MSEEYSSLQMANTFIQRHAGSVGGIQHMKLQKLAYYAYGWWLAFKDTPVLNERPEVWQYGPVFSGMYDALKGFGAEPITAPINFNSSAPVIQDEEVLNLVDWIWGKYGDLSAAKLSDMTHAKDTPWYQVAEAHNFSVPRHFKIDDKMMKTYFQEKAKKDNL